MHTEHLQNVHPVRVLAGWLVAVAATSALVFGFIVVGFMSDTGGPRETLGAVLAVGLGFLVGGLFTGYRTVEAPILHGIGLGLTSLVAWAVLNLLVATAFGSGDWSGLNTTAALAVLLTQILAAVAGCWFGTAQARARMEPAN
jgi:MFS family permease